MYTADYIYYDGELYHAQKKQHKYIARVQTTKGKYRYFYTREEYAEYKQNKESPKPKKTSMWESVSKFFKKAKNSIRKLFKKSKKELGESLEKGRKFVDEVILGKKKPKKSSISIDGDKKVKYIARIKLPNGKHRYFYDQDEYDRYLSRKEYQKNEPDFMKKVRKIADGDSCLATEDMAEINEEYSPYDKDRSYNCRYCSMAYELRCRGYDVQAADKGSDISYLFRSNLDRLYKNPKEITIDESGKEYTSILNETKLHKKFDYDADTVKRAINKHSGNNTRGEIAVSWKSGGAHSMIYEVDSKGKITIRDCQTNSVHRVEELVGIVNKITITRTDNLELKEGILKCVEDN